MLNILIMEKLLCIFLEISQKKQDKKFKRIILQHQKGKWCLKNKYCSFKKITLSKREISRDMLLTKWYTLKASFARFIDILKKSKR